MGQLLTFDSIAALWLGEKKKLVKHSTYCAYLLAVKTHLLPEFSSKSEVCEDDAQQFVYAKLASGLSRKTVHDILAILRAIMKFAAKHCGLPAPDWDVTFPTSTECKPLPVLSLSDERRLLRHIFAAPTSKNIGVLLALCTGMRIGEVCALRWSDINLTRRVITVSHTAARIYNADVHKAERLMTSPKTRNSNREIPIAPLLHQALCVIKKGAKADFVVSDNETAADPRTYRDYFSRLLRRIGIPHIVFHGLRHTFATRCIESGCDYKTVSVILGHSNIATTLNLYVHPNMEQQKKCIDRMTKSLNLNV